MKILVERIGALVNGVKAGAVISIKVSDSDGSWSEITFPENAQQIILSVFKKERSFSD